MPFEVCLAKDKCDPMTGTDDVCDNAKQAPDLDLIYQLSLLSQLALVHQNTYVSTVHHMSNSCCHTIIYSISNTQKQF